MIDRDIILDLLPLYRAGLGSAKTRAAVEAWLAAHPEAGEAPAAMPEGADWRTSFDRARSLSRRRRWVFGAAMVLTALCLATEFHFGADGFRVRLVALGAPLMFAPLALAAVIAWVSYWRMSRQR